MDLKDKLLTIVFAALYTSLFFNWYIYLIQVNFEVMIDMSTELTQKGLLIGFSGAMICDRVKIADFAPFGWIGVLVGFNATNYLIIPWMTRYPSLLGLDLAGTLAFEFLFMKMVVVGTVLYTIGRYLWSFTHGGV